MKSLEERRDKERRMREKDISRPANTASAGPSNLSLLHDHNLQKIHKRNTPPVYTFLTSNNDNNNNFILRVRGYNYSDYK